METDQASSGAPRQVMVSPAPVIVKDDGIYLDGKFVEGMMLHSRMWGGDFDCILRTGAERIPFGITRYDGDAHTFGVTVLGPDETLTIEHLRGYDLVFCSADDDRNTNVPALARQVGARLATTLEYTLKTRLQIIWLDRHRSLPRRIYGVLKVLRNEIGRRRFLREMDGIQANGYPGYEMCLKFDPDTLLFLDNRMMPEHFVTAQERESRYLRLRQGAPLRLVYSGRLEFMKGVQDLVPIACRLRDQGVPFSLDIFGAGRLHEEIARGIEQQGLTTVQLHDAIDFETELVPYLRQNADIYLCCHRQSDPSCTYIENMGCGLAVVGYGNQMWSALNEASQSGWCTPVGDPAAVGAAIMAAHQDRETLIRHCENAADFAMAHDFPGESRKRIDHLKRTVGKPLARSGAD